MSRRSAIGVAFVITSMVFALYWVLDQPLESQKALSPPGTPVVITQTDEPEKKCYRRTHGAKRIPLGRLTLTKCPVDEQAAE